jgi:SAM-dependent methyltransferase
MLIIDCRNLIGDTIYLIKPLRNFLATRPSDDVALGIKNGLPGEIVRRSFPDLRIDRTEVLEGAWPGAQRITLSARAAWESTRTDDAHISQGYARVLETELQGGIAPDLAWLPPADAVAQPEHIVLAPFSVSCARHRGEAANKTLEEHDWAALLKVLRRQDLPLRIVGGPDERFSTAMGFAESDYFTAANIEDLLAFLRRSCLVVGVDTGICHVSSCAGVPTVVLWSAAANLEFIGETWAPRTRIVQIGLPSTFDAYRVDRLLENAVRDLLGPRMRSAPADLNIPAIPGNAADGSPAFPLLDSVRFMPLRYAPGGLGNWSGHLPFARDLVASLRPRLFVELGTHYGESYFGICQSVAEAGRECSCYAVDTWRGDSHSLDYGEEVYREVDRYNSKQYAAFSRLLRMKFDDALCWFADESIDLLHIDGLHTYDAVKGDFDAWYPKVAPGGVVLLHDSAERYADFGVWKLWEEISSAHDSFEFHHAHGLGVIRKAGDRRAHGGILDYIFLSENAEAIRGYYVLCADRLDARDAMCVSAKTAERNIAKGSPVYVDPGDDVIRALTGSAVPGALEGDFFATQFADSDCAKTDWTPVDGKAKTWLASTRDPGALCGAGFDASAMRFFVVVMACSCAEPRAHAQLFWTGQERAGLNERLSVRFPLIADGRPHAYVVDLHTGAGLGAVNHLWWHAGKIDAIRFDPLDVPGEFTISAAGFTHQERAEASGVREGLGLPPLRTELSDRYLRGSGIEIGALQNPLALRPDTHVRYVDRLTIEKARAHFPELDAMALVTPSIICDAAALRPIRSSSVDFVIANHVIEHLRDPIAGLGEWLRVVRPGGHVYVAAPEHTNPLDRLRDVTELDHLLADFKNRAKRTHFDREHYREWAASTRPDMPADQRAKYESELVAQGYDIHFHTFSRKTFAGLLDLAGRHFPFERIELRHTYGTTVNEFIAILRKR